MLEPSTFLTPYMVEYSGLRRAGGLPQRRIMNSTVVTSSRTSNGGGATGRSVNKDIFGGHPFSLWRQNISIRRATDRSNALIIGGVPYELLNRDETRQCRLGSVINGNSAVAASYKYLNDTTDTTCSLDSMLDSVDANPMKDTGDVPNTGALKSQATLSTRDEL